MVNSTEFMSLRLKKLFLILWSIFWGSFSFKTQFFFQVQGTEIDVEVNSSHVFGSNIENHLSSGE